MTINNGSTLNDFSIEFLPLMVLSVTLLVGGHDLVKIDDNMS